ncbi:unnamed protein product [Clavelina lepadiformis]|uniref:Uncharacterized protein n=1 Tax=Clavelina lepadiformis TaxID=159417 RepID=A0ABP0GTB6_CLALP
MSTSKAPSDGGFLPTYHDIVVYASCIGGIAGFFVLFGFAGFVMNQLGIFDAPPHRQRRRKRPKNEENLKVEEVGDRVEDPCPTWYHKVLGLVGLTAGQKSDTERQRTANDFNSQDAIEYVNQVFAGIDDEQGNGDKTKIGYEKENKNKNKKKKPKFFISYKKKKKSNGNNDNTTSRKLCVESNGGHGFAATEEQRDLGKLVAMDTPTSAKSSENGGAGLQNRKLFLPRPTEELNDHGISSKRHQLVEYEKPKERAVIEELQRREMLEKKKIKIQMERAPSSSGAKDQVEGFPAQKMRKIPTERRNQFQQEVDNNDSFLY